MTGALVNATTPNKSAIPYTYLGSSKMSEWNDLRRCSLCGVTITHMRTIKPIIRWDETHPYYHRTGRSRGLRPDQRIGWACGRHHIIDPNWLGNSDKMGIDTVVSLSHTSAVTLEAREEVKEIRLRLGLSQNKFARKLGVTTGAVSKWESGERTVTERTLLQARSLLMTNKDTAA